MNTHKYYLIFADRAAAIAVLVDYYSEDADQFFSTPVVDVLDIGDLQHPTGETTTDAEGNSVPVVEILPGYHVNVCSRQPIPALDQHDALPTNPLIRWLL